MTNNLTGLSNLRLAVLIDAENVPRNCIKSVMEEIAIYGTPTIKRIYGDWTSPNVAGWKSSLLQNAITPIQQYSYTSGKNSSDSAMIIDAMDILYTNRTDGFVLVSSDSDFTRLAIRLREAGQRVIGIGEKKTPNAFIAACDKFIYIEVITKKPATGSASGSGKSDNTTKQDNKTLVKNQLNNSGNQNKNQVNNNNINNGNNQNEVRTQNGNQPPPAASQFTTLTAKVNDANSSRTGASQIPDEVIDLIASSITDLAGDSGSVFMGELGNLILKKQPDFDHRNFGHKSLSALIKSIDRFEIEFRQTADPNIKHVFVRDTES